MSDYETFLRSKERRFEASGIEPGEINPMLFPFQQAIVKWAIRRGRAAIFAGTGLGKTVMQLEWAKQILGVDNGRVLLVSPLCVAEQTILEARNLGMDVAKVARPTEDRFQITNYEKLQHFVDAGYKAIVCDESGIFKHVEAKTRTLLIEHFSDIPFRLCCTATPSPNDISEIGNHAQFLGVMSYAEMLATFFVHDDQVWRLKGHAQNKFWEWLASWCVYVRKPMDIGFEDDQFDLPPLHIHEHSIKTDFVQDGFLFAVPVSGLKGRRDARRNTITNRISAAVSIVKASNEPFLIWCGLNDEAIQVKKALVDSAIEISGKDDEDTRLWALQRWMRGDVQTLVSKVSIFGFGMNFQHCPNIIFLGLGDSWEEYYQAIRRSWRFGQKNPVHVHLVISNAEVSVLQNINRKERDNEHMAQEVIDKMGDLEKQALSEGGVNYTPYVTETQEDAIGRWKMMQGDCVDRMRDVPDNSVDLSIFSPPFASLYTYSATERDMGNSADYGAFFDHFRYLVPELLRVTKPGRIVCVHCQQVALKKVRDGKIGWRDFRGDLIREFEKVKGWTYGGEVVSDRNPQADAVRTKSKSLLFVQLRKDSIASHPCMADYILLFYKDGDNAVPVIPDIDNETWIQWAHPIWYGIRGNDTLHVAEAREEKDERHICPLQLGIIERCVRLWSNPGELVLSPFAGIGSEGYQSLKLGRKFVGIELKGSYYRAALKNLKSACQATLFDTQAVG